MEYKLLKSKLCISTSYSPSLLLYITEFGLISSLKKQMSSSLKSPLLSIREKSRPLSPSICSITILLLSISCRLIAVAIGTKTISRESKLKLGRRIFVLSFVNRLFSFICSFEVFVIPRKMKLIGEISKYSV